MTESEDSPKESFPHDCTQGGTYHDRDVPLEIFGPIFDESCNSYDAQITNFPFCPKDILVMRERDFSIGDSADPYGYTGRSIEALVTTVEEDGELEPDHVLLGLKVEKTFTPVHKCSGCAGNCGCGNHE